jgi:hypothetical protein
MAGLHCTLAPSAAFDADAPTSATPPPDNAPRSEPSAQIAPAERGSHVGLS